MAINEIILQDATTNQWLHFRRPLQIITAFHLEEVRPQLDLVETLVSQREVYAAGFLTYEAAPAFDPALRVRPSAAFPLLWFGLYPQPEIIAPPLPTQETTYRLGAWKPSLDRQAFAEAIAQIKTYIARGHTYQVNYTFRLSAPFTGDTWRFFCDLVTAQQGRYAAYMDTEDFTICSVSPELFFQLDQRHLSSRPMKGTAARGRTLMEDEAQATWLRRSEKNQAENIMIVDMIRNDIGRIAAIGSVQAPRLFEAERYPTLWQMTSTVTAESEASLSQIVAALFPCASITGAPKVRTMQLIAELETTPRHIYTGAIGFISPRRKAQFNVAIRTVLIDKATNQAEYGVGSGIVWDSISDDEYTECQLKAQVLTQRRPSFALLETMLWTPDEGYSLLPYHLERLRDSAAYFAIPLDLAQLQQKLAVAAATLPSFPHKARLLVAQDGAISCQTTLLATTASSEPIHLGLALAPVDSTNPFLYHKTTHRQVYNIARAGRPECDDVLLWNERGEVTESTIANIVVQLDGRLMTPPIHCGLLPGVFRAWLLAQQKVQEEVITLDALRQSHCIYLVNSVRGWREAVVDLSSSHPNPNL